MSRSTNYALALFCAFGALANLFIAMADMAVGQPEWAAFEAATMSICGFAAYLCCRDARRVSQ